MNTEEITKKLEKIRADAFDKVSSHDEKSQAHLEDYNRVELDEDVAGEDVKLERTKGKDFPTPKTLSRTTPMDGGKRPKEDIYVYDATLKSPSIDELQNKLDDLKKDVRPYNSQQQDYMGMEKMHETAIIKLLVNGDIDPNTFTTWLQSEEFNGFMERFSDMYVKKYGTDAIPDKDLARREEPKGGPAGFRERDDIMFDYERY